MGRRLQISYVEEIISNHNHFKMCIHLFKIK